MSEEKQKKEQGSVNIGAIKGISGGTFNIAGSDINQAAETPDRQIKVDTGGGAYIGGSVTVGGGNFIGRDSITYGSTAQRAVDTSSFEIIRKQVALVEDPATRGVLLSAVNTLEKEAQKGLQANEGIVKIWLTVLTTSSEPIHQAVKEAFRTTPEGFSPIFTEMSAAM